MHATDVWGNVRWCFPKPGDLFNRRESAWYAEYHRMMSSTKRALTRFIMGDKETAQELVKVILEVDAVEKNFEDKNMPNSFARLNDEFKTGRMFATQEDLKHFKGKMKTQLLVADYYYEIEQWPEAAKRYRQFDKEWGDNLDKVVRNYVDMMLGYSAQTEKRMDVAIACFEKVFKNGKNTPSWPRTAFTMYTYLQNFDKTEDRAFEILQEVFKVMGPNTDEGMYAYVFQGIHLYCKGKLVEARAHFQKMLKNYGNSVYCRSAKHYLQKVEARLQKEKGE